MIAWSISGEFVVLLAISFLQTEVRFKRYEAPAAWPFALFPTLHNSMGALSGAIPHHELQCCFRCSGVMGCLLL